MLLLLASVYVFFVGLFLHAFMTGAERLPRRERPTPNAILVTSLIWPAFLAFTAAVIVVAMLKGRDE